MKYKNPWHAPLNALYGPSYYETHCKPEEYKGHLIYNRIPGKVYDIVKDDVCLMQMAGLNGAKRWIDQQEQTNL